jgi:cation:H+ antiporter
LLSTAALRFRWTTRPGFRKYEPVQTTPLVFFVLGLLLLIAGGELLVRGASRLARRAGISELVVGLTVVAFGTSSPEMVVSILSALQGKSEIAVGNVVGSNIFNVLFILGLAALIRPLVVARNLVRRDIPVMIAASLLCWGFALDLHISRMEALVLVAGVVAFTVYTIRASRREPPLATGEAPPRPGARGWLLDGAAVLGGLVLLVLGARWLVEAAVTTARALGVDEAVIALTIVAAGTSLPEVVTSVVATARGKSDIAVGNVVGSNIFNILAILGISSMFGEGGLRVAPSIENFDLPVMIAVAIACLPFLASGHLLARWEGAVFLGYYILYASYLVLEVQQHAALPLLGRVTGWFVLPLTGLSIAVIIARRWRRPGRGAAVLLLCAAAGLPACTPGDAPRVDTWDGGAYRALEVRAYEIAGTREGEVTRATARITLKDGSTLRMDLVVTYNPTPVLASGHWELDGPFAGRGEIRARSIKFFGGQGEGPSLGGSFDLTRDGAPHFRVFIPARPLPRPTS